MLSKIFKKIRTNVSLKFARRIIRVGFWTSIGFWGLGPTTVFFGPGCLVVGFLI